MRDKIVTLENEEKFLIITEIKIKNEKFLVGVKVVDERYENDFRFFVENNKNGEKFLEEIKDESLIKLIVDKYILSSFN